MAISTGDILRVAPRLLWNTVSDLVNVFWLQVLDDDGADLATLVGEVVAAIETIYDSIESNFNEVVTFEDISVFNHTQDESYGSVGWDTLTQGGETGSAMPPGDAVFCYFPTFTPNVQGRCWISGFSEIHNDDGLWSSGLVSAVAGAVNTLLSDYTFGTTGQFRWVIPHFIEKGEELVTPEFLPYNASVVSNNPGYQRRRRPGAGS